MQPPKKPQSLLRKGAQAFLLVMGRRHLVTVLGTEDKSIWVSFPGVGYPSDGAGANLEFHHDSGVEVYHTQVVRSPRKPDDGLVLERSETAERRTHRSSWRVPTDLTIVVRDPTAPNKYSAVMENLSVDGALIRTYAPLNLRGSVEISFTLPKEPSHTVPGRVVYAVELSKLRHGPHQRFGIKFTDVPPEAEQSIVKYLYRRVRKLYPSDVRALYPRST